MTAVGRLWRRAPGWRVCLIAAIAFTALAAMFPPALPPWLTHWPFAHPLAGADAGDTAATANSGKPAAARYVRQPDPALPDYETIESPPFGPGRAGAIPFAARLLALPSGTWQELILARGSGAVAVQAALFGRVEDRHLTGLMLAAAPDPLAGAAAPVTGLAPCFATDAIAHQIVPATPDQGPLTHECWTLTAFDMRDAVMRSGLDDVMRAGLDRLDGMSIIVPDHMLALRYLRSDETGWLTALLLLPERHAERPGADPRLPAWAKRFAALLHKGFDGTLTPGELAAGNGHDPE